jgi:hypothetical protein
MPQAGRPIEDYEIDISWTDELYGLPDNPQLPLDLDTRRIDGDTLQSWRKRQVGGSLDQYDYPTSGDVSGAFGVAETRWRNWERRDMPQRWSALFREWVRSGQSFTARNERVPAGYVQTLQDLFGTHRLADGLDVAASTVSAWKSTGDVAVRGGSAALVWWLVGDLSLEPTPVRDGVRQVSDDEVREIIRRHRGGDTYDDIAEDYPISKSGVGYVVRRDHHTELTIDD